MEEVGGSREWDQIYSHLTPESLHLLPVLPLPASTALLDIGIKHSPLLPAGGEAVLQQPTGRAGGAHLSFLISPLLYSSNFSTFSCICRCSSAISLFRKAETHTFTHYTPHTSHITHRISYLILFLHQSLQFVVHQLKPLDLSIQLVELLSQLSTHCWEWNLLGQLLGRRGWGICRGFSLPLAIAPSHD